MTASVITTATIIIIIIIIIVLYGEDFLCSSLYRFRLR